MPVSMNALLVGYAKVSAGHQNLTSQRDALHVLGVGDDRIYVDHGCQQRRKVRQGRGLNQRARLGTLTFFLPQSPDRIDDNFARSAESMLSRQRYFVFTKRMA